MTSLVAEVATASDQQTSGVGQINTAVSQMDRITQSNAANAEESASASEELSAQAIELNEMVEQVSYLVNGANQVQSQGKLMAHCPIPVVVVSTLTMRGGEVALEAVRSAYHARDRLAKRREVPKVIRPELPAPLAKTSMHLIAIGASTGGTVAIESILEHLPGDLPGIVMVQHMPAFFTKSFAERLSKLCKLRGRCPPLQRMRHPTS